MLPDSLPGNYRGDWDKAVAGMCADGVPVELAHQLANTMVLGSAPDIIEIAAEAQRPLTDAAQIYFLVGDRLNMLWLLSTIIAFPVHSKWQALARSNLREDSYRSEENTSELPSLLRNSYAVFCLKKKTIQ